FISSRLDGGRFRGASIKDAWVGDSSLRGVDWGAATVEGVYLSKQDLTELASLPAAMPGCRFHSCGMGGMDLSARDVSGALFPGADLTGAKLAGCKFPEADFGGARLRGADFTGADLTGAQFLGADFDAELLVQASVLHQALFHGREFPGVD